MVLVTAYRNLRKPGRDGSFYPFNPLRAVGLAVEQGWKANRDKGLGVLQAADVSQVSVGGKLLLQTGQRWRAAASCTLQVRPQDAALATAVVHKQRALLSDLRLNVWSVDKGGGAKKRSLDLLADFSTAKNFGVNGRLWVELKVLSSSTFESEMAKYRTELEEHFAKESRSDASLGGVLLLAARVAPGAGAGWSAPTLVALLKKRGAPDWQTLAGGSTRKGRGRCQSTKPPLGTLWQKVEWFQQQEGVDKVGLLKHFLQALQLPCKNPGQRAKTFNALLKRGCCKGHVFTGKLKNKCGRKPWVATKKTFRDLYTYL